MSGGLVLTSELPEAVNARLRDHRGVARVLAADPKRPWAAAVAADVFLVSPSAYWKSDPPRPLGSPGRIRFIQSASAGVDWYPRWLLDAAPTACGRGVAAEPIGEFVMAAVLDHARAAAGAPRPPARGLAARHTDRGRGDRRSAWSASGPSAGASPSWRGRSARA
jgi:phosphoglycerate dehydrogenase-like enzyme